MPRLWIILGSIFTVAVLMFGSFTAVNALAHDEIETHDVVSAAAVDELVVDMSSGSIDIVGDPDATDITVDAKISSGLRPTEYSISQTGGRLAIDSDCTILVAIWCRADLTITMPSDIPLDLRTHNGGIEITDIDVGIVARTSNGSIDLIGVSGDVDTSTSNGPIRGHGLAGDSLSARSSNGSVELTFSEPPTAVSARTSNGSVKITVPDDPTAYDVAADTDAHSSSQVTVRTDPTSDNAIEAKTSNGSISIFYPTD